MGQTQSVQEDTSSPSSPWTKEEIQHIAFVMTDPATHIEKKIHTGTQLLGTSTRQLSTVVQALEDNMIKLQSTLREEGSSILARITQFLLQVSKWAADLLSIVTGHKVSLRLALTLLGRPMTKELSDDLANLLAKEGTFVAEMDKCSQLIDAGSQLVRDIDGFISKVNSERSSRWLFAGCILGVCIATLGLVACVAFPPCVFLLPELGFLLAAGGVTAVIATAASVGAVCAEVAAVCGRTASKVREVESALQSVVNNMGILKHRVNDYKEQLKKVNISLSDARAKHHLQETIDIAKKYNAMDQLVTGWNDLLKSTEDLEQELTTLVKICNS